MPDETLFWIVLVVVVGLLGALALWKGRGVRVTRHKDAFSVEVERSADARPQNNQRVQVAEDLRVEGAEVGDIAGMRSSRGIQAQADSVEVAKGATVTASKVGDIVGVVQTGTKAPDEPS